MCNWFQNKSPTHTFAVYWETWHCNWAALCYFNGASPTGSVRWGHCMQRHLACEGLYWLGYKMKAAESVQITLQIFKYVMYADVAFQNDSCFMTLVASAPKYSIGVILLQIHCNQSLTLGVKTVSSCKFRAALILALISTNFILFDMVSQIFFGKMVAIWHIGNLFLTNPIAFACFENIYLEVNIIHLW